MPNANVLHPFRLLDVIFTTVLGQISIQQLFAGQHIQRFMSVVFSPVAFVLIDIVVLRQFSFNDGSQAQKREKETSK